MRSILLAFFFVLSGVLFTESFAQEQSDVSIKLPESFKMKGLVSSKGSSLKEGQIFVYKNNDVVDQQKIKKSGKFSIKLDPNAHYTLEFAMVGHLSKKVVVYTNINDVQYWDNQFKFDVMLYSDKFVQGMDHDFFDYPVAIIAYDKETENFAAIDSYTNDFQQELKSMYIKKQQALRAQSQ